MDQTARETLDQLPDGVVVAGDDEVVELANAEAVRMLGATSADDLVGQKLKDALVLQDQSGETWCDRNQPYLGLATRTGVPEQPWVLPNGTEVLVNARILRPSLTEPIERVVVSLRSGRGRARLDRERSDLVATVAHEIRSPLTGVKGFVQALLNRWDKLNDDQKKLMLTTVNADSDRLSRLIAELLDVARIDTGRLSLFPRPADLEVLVQRVVDSVRAGTSRPVELAVGPGLPEAHVDPDKFTQVITNLIENGIRHGDGVVSVTLSAIAEEADFDGVLLTVDDEGSGIPEEMRRRVFTKFWKHGERGGSGLGMYIVNGLVRAHGGVLTIGDSPAGGARIATAWPEDDRRQL
ncbi:MULTISPECIES: ATP-binding protein [unclassified Nocardioides]|uniref:sensor histidine kinase n=1 Tax=unclassified Nocardioides TaxID=2615069 RepID=UPI0006FBECDC|nr:MULTISPECIES: ATP-binding protein [unclassified Nocardioides]KQY54210.1 PAS domain-containing sensor histidine kinase [Nocardioides sp. Root140]KQZ74835.1 PAS domain-containing sensor histidine kinase [Nocardioides sp. Root151]KRF10340.1 PAS domain-containing sensor histidine kinase [Nocardioides sp. Soil796]